MGSPPLSGGVATGPCTDINNGGGGAGGAARRAGGAGGAAGGRKLSVMNRFFNFSTPTQRLFSEWMSFCTKDNLLPSSFLHL